MFIHRNTEVPFHQFVIGTWLGVLPGTTAYVSMGAVAGRIQHGDAPESQLVLYGIGAIATILVSIQLSRVATRALNDVGVGNTKKE